MKVTSIIPTAQAEANVVIKSMRWEDLMMFIVKSGLDLQQHITKIEIKNNMIVISHPDTDSTTTVKI